MTSQAIQVTGEDCSHVLDVATLMLRRMNAVPIRLKILLDRLLSTLDHDRIQAILHECGWTYDDYVRGYKLQVYMFTIHLGIYRGNIPPKVLYSPTESL